MSIFHVDTPALHAGDAVLQSPAIGGGGGVGVGIVGGADVCVLCGDGGAEQISHIVVVVELFDFCVCIVFVLF